MTVLEAKGICADYWNKTNPSEEDTFFYTEALRFLFEETKDSAYLVELGGLHYEARRFELALKYYELAAEYNDRFAMTSLGYIWYYGRTGEKDYEKAFHYFDKARRMGDLVAAYKVADMYRNGYYVEQDDQKYRAIIEKLYSKVRKARQWNEPLPEVFTRLAKIRSGEGKIQEALRLYDEAKRFLAWRIQAHPFFGDLNIMKWMTEDIYRLRPFDADEMWLYDLYYLLKAPVKVRFCFEDGAHEAEAVEEDGAIVIRFDDKWYRMVDDFFQKAELDGELLTARYGELYGFEVEA